MAIAKGTTVKQKVFVIQGEITSTRFNEDAGQLEYHVEYTDSEGNATSRWFLESDIEEA